MDTLTKVAIGKEIGELVLRGACLGSSTFLTFRVLKKAGIAVGVITGTTTGILSMLAVDLVTATAEKIIMNAVKPSEGSHSTGSDIQQDKEFNNGPKESMDDNYSNDQYKCHYL